MGSPLAPILAEINLSNFENKNIIFGISLKELFYYRYVEDIYIYIYIYNLYMSYLEFVNRLMSDIHY